MASNQVAGENNNLLVECHKDVRRPFAVILTNGHRSYLEGVVEFRVDRLFHGSWRQIRFTPTRGVSADRWGISSAFYFIAGTVFVTTLIVMAIREEGQESAALV